MGAGRGRPGGGEEPGIGGWGGIGVEMLTLGQSGSRPRRSTPGAAAWTRRACRSRSGWARRTGAPVAAADAAARHAPGQSRGRRGNPAGDGGARQRRPPRQIVATALTVMGTPYRWGGTNTDGFDCSGLIQYAYGQHGITLARRSVDQARAGSEVARELSALEPGDILTFASSPGDRCSTWDSTSARADSSTARGAGCRSASSAPRIRRKMVVRPLARCPQDIVIVRRKTWDVRAKALPSHVSTLTSYGSV